MPEFMLVKTFVLISQLGSLAAAGRKLNISAAALSKQINKLEKELGIQLLIRSTRKIELTELGRIYLEQCHRILQELEEASALVKQLKAEPSGSLKVVSGRHFARTYLIPFLPKFLELYPKIVLNLELAERIPDLQAEDVDLLIGMSLSATGNVIQKKISSTTYCYCASPNYFAKFGIPIKPEELKDHRYITHSMRKPDDELVFDGQKIRMDPYIHVNDTDTMLKLALAGLGIIKLHRYAVSKQLEEGLLIEIFKDYSQTPLPIYVAYPQRRFIASKIRCFIDYFTPKTLIATPNLN